MDGEEIVIPFRCSVSNVAYLFSASTIEDVEDILAVTYPGSTIENCTE